MSTNVNQRKVIIITVVKVLVPVSFDTCLFLDNITRGIVLGGCQLQSARTKFDIFLSLLLDERIIQESRNSCPGHTAWIVKFITLIDAISAYDLRIGCWRTEETRRWKFNERAWNDFRLSATMLRRGGTAQNHHYNLQRLRTYRKPHLVSPIGAPMLFSPPDTVGKSRQDTSLRLSLIRRDWVSVSAGTSRPSLQPPA